MRIKIVQSYIFFITTVLLTSLWAHYLIYVSIISFFPNIAAIIGDQLWPALFLLAFSFAASSLLVRLKENDLTRLIYFLSAIWLGILCNLLTSSLLTWLIVLIYPNLLVSSAIGEIATIIFGLSMVSIVYGMLNAFNPKIKNYEVKIKNLPDHWRGKRIVQLSDVHLGSIYRAKHLMKVIRKVNYINAEAVMITGDLFDGTDGSLGELITPLNSLKSRYGVFFITGNHETYTGLNEVFDTLSRTQLKILQNEVVDLDGLKVIGVSYHDRGMKDQSVRILDNLKNEFSNRPNVLLYHAPTHINTFKNMGVNLQLSGHTHRGQMIPINLLTRMMYKKYHYGIHQIDDYTLITSSGTGTWGPPIRTSGDCEINVITLT